MTKLSAGHNHESWLQSRDFGNDSSHIFIHANQTILMWETSWSLLIFPPKVTLYLLEGTTGSRMIIGHVHTPTKIFSIKVAAEAVGLSLQGDVSCDGTPSLETKALPWTVSLAIISQEYFMS